MSSDIVSAGVLIILNRFNNLEGAVIRMLGRGYGNPSRFTSFDNTIPCFFAYLSLFPEQNFSCDSKLSCIDQVSLLDGRSQKTISWYCSLYFEEKPVGSSIFSSILRPLGRHVTGSTILLQILLDSYVSEATKQETCDNALPPKTVENPIGELALRVALGMRLAVGVSLTPKIIILIRDCRRASELKPHLQVIAVRMGNTCPTAV